MEEQTFLRLALGVAILGVGILFLCTFLFEYPLTAIQDITTDLDGKIVHVQGEILSSRNSKDTSIFTLQDDTGTISIVLYNLNNRDLTKGRTVEVLGIVDEYQCNLEIKASEVTALGF